VHIISPLSLSPVDNEAVLAALMEAVENEDTPQSYAYAFLAASRIPDVDVSPLFDSIEDIVAQADETASTLYVKNMGGGGGAYCFSSSDSGWCHVLKWPHFQVVLFYACAWWLSFLCAV
jgi:ribosomal protein S12 methylthiotransferase accessory factor YcaO